MELLTKYVLNLDPDTHITENSITKLIEVANKIQEFSILAPKISGQDYSKYITKFDEKFKLNQISYSTGCALLLNASITQSRQGHIVLSWSN